MTRLQIKKRVKHWQKLLGLENWSIDCTFESTPKVRKDRQWVGVAFANTQSSYMECTINFLPGKLKLIDETVIVHELLHSLTAELTGYIRANIPDPKTETWTNYFEERLVSQIERIILRSIKEAKKE